MIAWQQGVGDGNIVYMFSRLRTGGFGSDNTCTNMNLSCISSMYIFLQVVYDYKKVLTTDQRLERVVKNVCKDLILVSTS